MKTDTTQRTVQSPASGAGRVAAYSIAAAGAAGAFATDSEAAVVYSGEQNISVNQYSSLNLKIDGDAYGDLKLKNYVFLGGPYQGATVDYFPGKLVGFATSWPYASALSAGAPINSSTLGSSFYGSLAYGAANPNAQFNNVTGAFIGLSFPSGGNTLFGWVRVTIDNASGIFVVNDWAYESTPGVGILAGDTGAIPEPASAGLLVALTVGGAVALRRRRETQAA